MKGSLKEANKSGDIEHIQSIKGLLTEEREFSAKQKSHRVAKQQKDQLKILNKDRVEKGMEPVYAKKREVKQVLLKDRFERLEKSGKLDAVMEK